MTDMTTEAPQATTSSRKRKVRKAGPLADRFWQKVDRRSPDECWPWTGSGYGYGYGGVMVAGVGCIGAHRVAYALGHNMDPGDSFVLHRCDNRRCCNPAHLFLGDQAANMEDMVYKGRSRARLRPEQALAARAMHQHMGWKTCQLAKKFNVSESVMRNLLAKTTYRHIGPDLTKSFLFSKT